MNLSDLTFHDGFQFCTNAHVPLQSTADNKLANSSSKAGKEDMLALKNLYIIDDDVVENFIYYFYCKYPSNADFNTTSSSRLILELCKSPQFQIKLIDFFIFFLYSADNIELLQDLSEKFSCKSLLNVAKDEILDELYIHVANNILDYLETYLPEREYLVYQPRTILEQNGLKSIQLLKAKIDFSKKTSHMVSLCDFIIGLLRVKELRNTLKLYRKVEKLVNNIFMKPKTFEFIKSGESIEKIDKPRILVDKSCQYLLEMDSIGNLIKKYTRNSYKEHCICC